jgi:NAD(P) transhydrogenase subunit alpha
VITTAQLFGRKAPLIVSEEIVHGMQKGSVLVDLAVESGGNVAGAEVDKEIYVDGVLIIGLGNLPGRVAVHASQMFSSNLYNLIDEFWDAEAKRFTLNFEDEIIQSSLITHEGQIINAVIAKHYSDIAK